MAAGLRQALMHEGIERSYLIRTPDESGMRNGPLPLVLVLHGGGGNAENAEQMTGSPRRRARKVSSWSIPMAAAVSGTSC
ncbi:MAG: hypothetical protein M5R42_21235 [Rhodocyclaceae bacterium]|nr:hypothetical protein [Rhodocyclaceae bacterium]